MSEEGVKSLVVEELQRSLFLWRFDDKNNDDEEKRLNDSIGQADWRLQHPVLDNNIGLHSAVSL